MKRYSVIAQSTTTGIRYHVVDQHDRAFQDGRVSLRIVDSFRSRRTAVAVMREKEADTAPALDAGHERMGA